MKSDKIPIPIGELKLRHLREICDSVSSASCELECPIKQICDLADNDIKKSFKEFVEVDFSMFTEAMGGMKEKRRRLLDNDEKNN